jgi:hypothetical protein
MAGPKIAVEFEINTDMKEMLEEAMRNYKIRDESKALRIVLDYVMEEGDMDRIFKKIRCRRCSPAVP